MKTIQVFEINELESIVQATLIKEKIESIIEDIVVYGDIERLGTEFTVDVINECIEESERLRTPWFLASMIYEKLESVLNTAAMGELSEYHYTLEGVQV